MKRTGFACPECSSAMNVIRTTTMVMGLARKRRCPACGFVLTTREVALLHLKQINVTKSLEVTNSSDERFTNNVKMKVEGI